jgi:hypothetical protein
MEGRAKDEDGRQVKCLTSDGGHVWMHYFDRLPAVVRRRLAESRHNVCAACLTIEVENRERRPSVATFFRVLSDIERQLDALPMVADRRK